MKMKLSNLALLLVMQVFDLPIFGQCIELIQYPSSTIIVNGSNPTSISGCNYAGDYAVLNFTSTGTYSFTAIGGSGNYITLTDGANNPLYFGYAPLTVSISTTGIYKVHFSLDASCGDENSCRSTQINPGGTLTGTCINTFQFPSSTVTIMTNTPTSISSCNFAGDYAVLDFPTAGTYTLISTGGSGNYITFTDASNNPIATGNSPLVVNITTPGIYYMHLSVDVYCTTDNICHTTYVQPFGWTPPPAPANDDCANAIPLTVPGTYTGTTIGATSEPTTVPTCTNTGLTQPGVWYSVVAANGGMYKASLCGTSGWDSKIFVYAGNNCSSLYSIGCNDDNGPDCSGTSASVVWCAYPGTTYYILVTGYSSPNNFTLSLSSFTPTLSYSVSPSTLCAGSSATITSVVTPTDNSTWSFTITAPSGATYTNNPAVITPTNTANYTLTAVNNKYFWSCALTLTFNIIVSNGPTVSVNVIDATAPGCSNGSATLNVVGMPPYNYTWMPNVSSSNVATNLSGTSGSGTTYTVVVTDANGCYSSITFSVDCVTGINSLSDNNNGVIIIPNPNNGIFNIQHELRGKVMFEIFDISGRKMQEFTSESSNVPVNISELARGMYIIRMHNEAVKVEVPVIKE